MSSIRAKFLIGSPTIPRLDVDLTLAESGVTGIFGPSGAGKTTLIRAIAGFETPQEGYLEVEGKVWFDSARQYLLPSWKRPLGYVFQNSGLFPHLTVEANLRFGYSRAQQKLGEQQFAEMVKLFELQAFLSRYPERLSGGERQRVALARAMLSAPEILLLDEPLAALDLKRRKEILPYLSRLANATCIPILYISHALEELAQVAKDLVLLANGRLVAHGSLTDLSSNTELAQSFFDDPGTVLDVQVVDQTADGLTVLSVSNAAEIISLYVPRLNSEVGETARVRISARDVTLTKQFQTESSVLNQLKAIITELVPARGASEILVRMDIAGQAFLARVTKRSCERLGLARGQTVYLQIKAIALAGSC